MNDNYTGRPHRRMSADYWKALISEVLEEAKADGHIITVRTEPRLPLTMGNYDLVVDVRERRVMAEPIVRSLPMGGEFAFFPFHSPVKETP